jgi:hypothetical protein
MYFYFYFYSLPVILVQNQRKVRRQNCSWHRNVSSLEMTTIHRVVAAVILVKVKVKQTLSRSGQALRDPGG